MSALAERAASPEWIAGRYKVETTLGVGGMGAVYMVLDTVADRRLALKQMLVDKYDGEDEKTREKRRARMARLFEREYHTLEQLAHPRIIEVYEYGVEQNGPFYTMELLDGGDLRGLAPLSWPRVCALLRDVCSALSLLHSRRLVHRDLSPRNIRCTSNGLAKLIDFGAMAAMGPCKQAAGTPPCVPPEVMHLQSLDARADLYAVGATAYYALTRRHAYPARSLRELRDAWLREPPLLSAYVKNIPEALESLVMSLISLDAAGRPLSAAEVMERLSAIAGLEIEEQLAVSQAYLTKPALAGREELRGTIRKQMGRAGRGQGGAVTVTGHAGMGRSRFLDACVLEGRLQGAIAVRADAADAEGDGYGPVRRMTAQLQEALPELAIETACKRMAVLGHVLPELWAASGKPELEVFEEPGHLRPRVQEALREWLLELSEHRALVVAVDDVHRVDEPSAALVAALAHTAANHKLMVAVTAETDAPATAPAALRLIRQAGEHIELGPLSSEQTREMLASVFGEGPNLRLIADRIHKIVRGIPRDVMGLAQHLVDRGVIRYRAGAWSLPTTLNEADIPGTVKEALQTRLQGLSPRAYGLAEAMALSPDSSFSFDECLLLTDDCDASRLMRSLDDLVAAEVLWSEKGRYGLTQQGWVSAIVEDLDEERGRALHVKLAGLFGQRPTAGMKVFDHLLHAGQEERGLDLLLEQLSRSIVQLNTVSTAFSKAVASLPRNWADLYERAIQACLQLGRPAYQVQMLRYSLVAMNVATDAAGKAQVREAIEQLYRDSGLGFYEELDDSMEASARLGRALHLAQERYDAAQESERVFAPADAIRELASMVILAIPISATRCEYELWESLPSLQPFVPLSPALDIVEKLRVVVGDLLRARISQARQGYLEVRERLRQPDHAGLDETTHTYTYLTVVYALGSIDALVGVASALRWADEMEADPLFRVNAWRIRMLYHLSQCSAAEAEFCRRRAELLQIENSPTQFYDKMTLFSELLAHVRSDNLMDVKCVMVGIEEMAQRFEGWVPILHYARGEYHRIRGDHRGALQEFDRVLSLTVPGRHMVWPNTAGAYVSSLTALGRAREAKSLGEQWLEVCDGEEFGEIRQWLNRPLALAEAELGEYESARSRLEATIEDTARLEMTGLELGLAYEARARLAICMDDKEGFETYAALCAEQYQAGRNPALSAKYERLEQGAEKSRFSIRPGADRTAEPDGFDDPTAFTLADTVLSVCPTARERAQRALSMLMIETGAARGHLFVMKDLGPALAASEGETPAGLQEMVSAFASAERASAVAAISTAEGPHASEGPSVEWTAEGGDIYRLVLLETQLQQRVVLAGVAALRIDRESEFRIPQDVTKAVSSILITSGEVSTLYDPG